MQVNFTGQGCSSNHLFSAGFREVDAVVVDSGGRLHDSAKIKSAYQLADGGHEYKTAQWHGKRISWVALVFTHSMDMDEVSAYAHRFVVGKVIRWCHEFR